MKLNYLSLFFQHQNEKTFKTQTPQRRLPLSENKEPLFQNESNNIVW